MEKLREGKSCFICINGSFLVTFECSTYLHFIQKFGYSYCLWVNPLSWVMSLLWVFSKNASFCIALCPGICLIKSILLILRSCRPMFKGKLCWESPSAVKTTCIPITFESILWLLHTQIPEIYFEFHVVDVGFIMALLRRDYSYQLKLIFQGLVLETKKHLEIGIHQWHTFSLSTIGLHHWPLIERFSWVFDISTSIHICMIVLGYLGNHWH